MVGNKKKPDWVPRGAGKKDRNSQACQNKSVRRAPEPRNGREKSLV